MKIKRYVAKSMPEALQMVKAELGPDAVIVHSRPLPLKPWLPFIRRPELEVVAAADTVDPRPAAMSSASRAEFATRLIEAKGSVTNDLALRQVSRDVADLKAAFDRLVQRAEMPHIFKLAPSLVALHDRLIAQDVEPELAESLIMATNHELSEAALQDSNAARDCLTRQITRLVSTRDPLAIVDGQRTVFLIGPTGVGKTTTIAKLAANFALAGRGRVALVTTDTFRIAAVPQLKTYADIIQVPLDVVYSPAELRELLKIHRDKRLLLVDSPGRSPNKRDQIDELGEFIQAAPNREVLLTVSASTKPRDLEKIAGEFGRLQIDGLIITKVDETSSLGPILGLLRRTNKPVSHLTTGQQVPQDIENATPARFAELVLGGEL